MVYFADAYMKLWVRMEDAPYVAFLIPNKKSQTHTASGISHLPPHWVRRQFSLLLHDDRDGVSYLANKAISQRDLTREHLLEMEA